MFQRNNSSLGLSTDYMCSLILHKTIYFQQSPSLTSCHSLQMLKSFFVGLGTRTYRGSKDAATTSENADSKRRGSNGSNNSFNFGESEAAEEEGEFLSNNIEVDAEEIKIDVKVEDMLGDLSWYFDDSSNKKTKKGKSETAKGEQEKEKEQNEENGSDEVND